MFVARLPTNARSLKRVNSLARSYNTLALMSSSMNRLLASRFEMQRTFPRVQYRQRHWGSASKKKQIIRKEKLAEELDSRRTGKVIVTGPPMNMTILQMGINTVSVVDQNGKLLGTRNARDAVNAAKEINLDLVLVAPKQSPPVCKLQPISGLYGSWGKPDKKTLYRKEKESRLNTRLVGGFQPKVKELRLSESISEYDLQVKVTQGRHALKKDIKLI